MFVFLAIVGAIIGGGTATDTRERSNRQADRAQANREEREAEEARRQAEEEAARARQEEEEAAQAQEEAEPPPEEEQPEAVPVGTPVTAGDLEWTVTNAAQSTELVSQFGEFGTNKTGNFVIVDFTVMNTGSEAVYVPSESLVLLDSENREFQTDTDSFEYVPPDKNILIEQINPGVSGDGQVIFSVAPGASGFTLRLGDASFFGTETGLVNLGF